MTWLRCSSPSCYCSTHPRIVASTGEPYTVVELARDGRGRVRYFRYTYGEARA
jgi:hypothetical protein